MNVMNMNINNGPNQNMIQNPNFNPLIPPGQQHQLQPNGHQLPSMPQAQGIPQQYMNQSPNMQFPQQVNMNMNQQFLAQQAQQAQRAQVQAAQQAQAHLMQQQQQPIPGQQQQPINQQMGQQMNMQMNQIRPGMQRAATIQQIGGNNPNLLKTPNQVNAFNPMHPPNSAPLPSSSSSHSAGNSNTHTPQMGNQPQPNGLQNAPFQQQINLQKPPQNMPPSQHPSQPPNPGVPHNQNVPPGHVPGHGPGGMGPGGPGPIGVVPGQQQPHMQRGGPANARINGPQRGSVPPGVPPGVPPQQQQPGMVPPNGKPGVVPGAYGQDQNDLNIKLFKRNLGNAGVVRILDIIEQVGSEPKEVSSTIEYWQKIVQTYFTPNSVLKLTMAPVTEEAGDDRTTDTSDHFELTSVTAPRFFSSVIRSQSFDRFSISLPGTKFQVMNNGTIFIISKLLITHFFSDGSVANVSGGCKILMNRDFRIEWIDGRFLQYQGSINSTNLQSIFDSIPHTNDVNDFKQELLKKVNEEPYSSKYSATFGLDPSSMRTMKLSDSMSALKSLIGFSMVNNVNSPTKALELFMTANSNHQAQFLKHRQAQQARQQAQRQAQQQALQQSQVQQSQPINNKNSNSSPSPRTAGDDIKFKKRKMSNSVNSNANSPLTIDPNMKRPK